MSNNNKEKIIQYVLCVFIENVDFSLMSQLGLVMHSKTIELYN